MTAAPKLEDSFPTELPFVGGLVKTEGMRGDPSKTTLTCAMCRMPRQVNADHLCRECDQRQAEAEACTSDLNRWERNEELFSDARALLGRVAQLLEDETCAKGRNEIRVTALRGAEIALREAINQLHRAGGV